MKGRLEGKRVILTDPGYYSGPGIVKVFEEEGAKLFADDRDLTEPGAAEDLVASVGHVDILIANHARPFAFTPAQEGTDEEMERLMSSIFYPMHRMIKAVLPQMLKRKNGKIVVASSVNAIKGRAGGATLYSAVPHTFPKNTRRPKISASGWPKFPLSAWPQWRNAPRRYSSSPGLRVTFFMARSFPSRVGGRSKSTHDGRTRWTRQRRPSPRRARDRMAQNRRSPLR